MINFKQDDDDDGDSEASAAWEATLTSFARDFSDQSNLNKNEVAFLKRTSFKLLWWMTKLVGVRSKLLQHFSFQAEEKKPIRLTFALEQSFSVKFLDWNARTSMTKEVQVEPREQFASREALMKWFRMMKSD